MNVLWIQRPRKSFQSLLEHVWPVWSLLCWLLISSVVHAQSVKDMHPFKRLICYTSLWISSYSRVINLCISASTIYLFFIVVNLMPLCLGQFIVHFYYFKFNQYFLKCHCSFLFFEINWLKIFTCYFGGFEKNLGW